MRVYVLFCHPTRQSFTGEVLAAFTDSLREAGHEVDLHDLYASGWQTDLDPGQYARETSHDETRPLPPDVAREQSRIDAADALAFVFPLWWSDCPAKLKGWFDRVWTLGYAYRYAGDARAAPRLSVAKALVLVTAGCPQPQLETAGIVASLRAVMLQDRLLGVGVREARLEILSGMVPPDPAVRAANLERARRLGREF